MLSWQNLRPGAEGREGGVEGLGVKASTVPGRGEVCGCCRLDQKGCLSDAISVETHHPAPVNVLSQSNCFSTETCQVEGE